MISSEHENGENCGLKVEQKPEDAHRHLQFNIHLPADFLSLGGIGRFLRFQIRE
jgi:hypothetical protein